MVDLFLNNIRSATNAADVIATVNQIAESDEIYSFSEFLSEPAIQALNIDPNCRRYYNLLQLFAYGKVFLIFDQYVVTVEVECFVMAKSFSAATGVKFLSGNFKK